MKYPICHSLTYENGKLYERIDSIRMWAEVDISKMFAYLKQGEEVKIEPKTSPYPLTKV